MLEQIAANGFAIVPNFLGTDETASLLDAVKAANEGRMIAGRGGLRNLLDRVPKVREFAESSGIRNLVEPILGQHAFAARGILFDKTPEVNWKVPWHQDLTIAVENKIEATGFGPWTVKDGVQHVQPPTEILESMLAVRVHLDECSEENGPLRLIPGSHSKGRLSAEQIHLIQAAASSVSCTVGQGGVLLMRPLLLHASSAAMSPNHRRVIHLEFASCNLPSGLRWYGTRAFSKSATLGNAAPSNLNG